MNRRDFLKAGALAAAPAGAQYPQLHVEPLRMKAGFAERDITPRVDPAKIHDPLKVRAAVFDDGSMQVALVGIDAIAVARPVVLAARRQIEERCGIPPEAVLVGASHTHSVERTSDPAYAELQARQIAEAVCQASAARVSARCGVGSGLENQVAFNRRLRMKNGMTYTHPGQGNPDIVGFAGPTDPEVGVVGAWDGEGRLLGCVVNYACHATTSPPGISANWIYYMEKVIRSLEPGAVVVFLQGACGDVTQVNNLSPYARPSGDQYARFVGGRVGAEAVKVLVSIHPGTLAPLAARSKVWRIPYRAPSPERVRRAEEIVKQAPTKGETTELRFARILLDFVAQRAKEPDCEVEVQAIQVGPAVFISNPAELFCQFGLDLKAASPFRFTYPVELANGSVGYVPTEEAFGPHGGGYETRLGVSRLVVTAGRQMVEAGLELARSMTPGPVPQPPPAELFRPEPGNIGSQPWSFGNVPPEIS